MFKKLNNKGNTLSIVLIGMFVLSILGTLILGATATNFNMKVNDKKAETTFYYAEKAIDEVYAGIGNEVMECIQDEYTDILEKYYSNNLYNVSYDVNSDFSEKVRNAITQNYKDGDIVNVSTPGTTNIQELCDRIVSNNYISAVANYNFSLFSPTSDETKITYYRKALVPGTTDKYTYSKIDVVHGYSYKDVSRIEIKNFGIRCDSNSNGYSSSVVTDFIIDIPDIKLDLSDSKSGGSLEDLAQYSLIAEGAHLNNDYCKDTVTFRQGNTKHPAITIQSGSKVTINGNIFADGTVYEATAATTIGGKTYYKNNYTSILNKNASVNVENHAKLTIHSKVLACMNDFVVQKGSEVTIGNKDGDNSVDEYNSLQFYANNIKTEDSGNGSSDRETKLDIIGNCIVKDDLELNGTYNRINLKGNYFGYGFRGVGGVESDSAAIEGFGQLDDTSTEHEESSAIIINGRNTDLNMSGVGKLILEGRAYIDLEANGTKAYYMTGESLSFKGNQHMYLADVELNGSKVAGSNPITVAELHTLLGKSSGITYSDLGFTDPIPVVAKQIGYNAGNIHYGDVFFYVRNNNPVNQTNYFMDIFESNSNNNANKRQNMLNQIQKLEVKNVSFNGAAYTVGAFMKVEEGELIKPVQGERGITKTEAQTVVNVIHNRIENLVPSLKDISSKYVLGEDDNIEAVAPNTSGAKTPYEYYIDREALRNTYTSRHNIVLIESNGVNKHDSGTGLTDAQMDAYCDKIRDILDDAGISYAGKKIGYWINAEQGISSVSVDNVDIGVIISEGPVTVHKDFVGLVLANGEITIQGNITISACEELTTFMLTSYPNLQNVLKEDLRSVGTDEDGNVVDAGSLKYTDIVSKDNWRRDYD